MKSKTKSLVLILFFLGLGFSLIPVTTFVLIKLNSMTNSAIYDFNNSNVNSDNGNNDAKINEISSKNFITKFNKNDGLLNRNSNSLSLISDVLGIDKNHITKNFLLKNKNFNASLTSNTIKNSNINGKLISGLKERIKNTQEKKDLDWTYFFYQDILHYLYSIYAVNVDYFNFKCYSFNGKEIKDIIYFLNNNPFNIKEDGTIKLDLTIKLTNISEKEKFGVFFVNNDEKIRHKLSSKQSVSMHILSTNSFSTSIIKKNKSCLLTWSVPIKLSFDIDGKNTSKLQYSYDSFVFNEHENYANVVINNASLSCDPYAANKVLVGKNKLFNKILLDENSVLNNKKTFTKLTDSLSSNFRHKYTLTLSILKTIGDISKWLHTNWDNNVNLFSLVKNNFQVAEDISVLVGNIYGYDYVPIIYSLLRSSEFCHDSKLDGKSLLTIIFNNKKILYSLINNIISPIDDNDAFIYIANYLLNSDSEEELRSKLAYYINSVGLLIPVEIKPLLNKLINVDNFYLFDHLLDDKIKTSQLINTVLKLLNIEVPGDNLTELTYNQKIIKFIFTWKDFLLDAIYASKNNNGSTFKVIVSKMIENISVLDPTAPNFNFSGNNLLADLLDLLGVNLQQLLMNYKKNQSLIFTLFKIFLFENEEIVFNNRASNKFLKHVYNLLLQINLLIDDAKIAYEYDLINNKLIKAESEVIVYKKIENFNNKPTNNSFLNKVTVTETDNKLIVDSLNYAYKIEVIRDFGIRYSFVKSLLDFLPKYKNTSEVFGNILYKNYDGKFFSNNIKFRHVKNKIKLKDFINEPILSGITNELVKEINDKIPFYIFINFTRENLLDSIKYLIWSFVAHGSNVPFYNFVSQILFGNGRVKDNDYWLNLNSLSIKIGYVGKNILVLPTYIKESGETKLDYQLVNLLQYVQVDKNNVKLTNVINSFSNWSYKFLNLGKNLNKLFFNSFNSFLADACSHSYLSHVILPLELINSNPIFINKKTFKIDVEPNLFVKDKVVNLINIKHLLQDSLENSINIYPTNEDKLKILETNISKRIYNSGFNIDNVVIKIDRFSIRDILMNINETVDKATMKELFAELGINAFISWLISMFKITVNMSMSFNIDTISCDVMFPYSVVDISDPENPKYINSVNVNKNNNSFAIKNAAMSILGINIPIA